MTGEEAIKIAEAFLVSEGISAWRLVGTRRVTEGQWSVVFDASPPGMKMDGPTIVDVDIAKGTAKFFLTL